MLVADVCVPDPVVQALQAVEFDMMRLSEIGGSPRPDRVVMEAVFRERGVPEAIGHKCEL